MTANHSRAEIHFSRKNRERLNKLKQEVKLRTGITVSVSRLVDEIVAKYFETEAINACNLIDNAQDSPRE